MKQNRLDFMSHLCERAARQDTLQATATHLRYFIRELGRCPDRAKVRFVLLRHMAPEVAAGLSLCRRHLSLLRCVRTPRLVVQ